MIAGTQLIKNNTALFDYTSHFKKVLIGDCM